MKYQQREEITKGLYVFKLLLSVPTLASEGKREEGHLKPMNLNYVNLT